MLSPGQDETVGAGRDRRALLRLGVNDFRDHLTFADRLAKACLVSENTLGWRFHQIRRPQIGGLTFKRGQRSRIARNIAAALQGSKECRPVLRAKLVADIALSAQLQRGRRTGLRDGVLGEVRTKRQIGG